MRPPPCAFMIGNTARAMRMYPMSLRLQSSSHWASGISRKPPPRIAPALLTSTSIRPPAARLASATTRSTSASCERSAPMAIASFLLRARASVASLSSAALSRAGDVVVGEVLPADRRLDHALQRLPRRAARRHPVGLEQLVHLEVQPRLVEPGRGLEGSVHAARRRRRHRAQGLAGPPRAHRE